MARKKRKTKKSYFKRSLEALVDSFKQINLRVSYVILFDVLFYIVLALLLLVWNTILKRLFSKISVGVVSNLASIPLDQLDKITDSMKYIFNSFLISIFLLAILIITIWSLSRGVIWCITL